MLEDLQDKKKLQNPAVDTIITSLDLEKNLNGEHKRSLVLASKEDESLIMTNKITKEGEALSPGTTLFKLAECLRQHGVHDSHISQHIIITIALISSRSGESLVTAISSDDDLQTQKILNICRQFVPEGIIQEIKFRNKKLVEPSGSELKHKTLIALNDKELKTAISLINQMNSECSASLVSAVSMENVDLKSLPYVLRVHIPLSAEIKKWRMLYEVNRKTQQQIDQRDSRSALVVKMLERISRAQVEISFAQLILNQLDFNRPDVEDIFTVIQQLICIITLINNVKSINLNEILSEYIKVNQKNDDIRESTMVISATKADYYYFYILFKEMLSKGLETLTDRQVIVFKAIYKLNFERLDSGCFSTDNDKNSIELLKQLHSGHNIRAWVDRETVYKEIIQDKSVTIPLTELDVELKHLLKTEYIKKEKSPHNKNKYLYGINKLDAKESIKLPDPSKIIDPVYNGATITVLNPLTGKSEDI